MPLSAWIYCDPGPCGPEVFAPYLGRVGSLSAPKSLPLTPGGWGASQTGHLGRFTSAAEAVSWRNLMCTPSMKAASLAA